MGAAAAAVLCVFCGGSACQVFYKECRAGAMFDDSLLSFNDDDGKFFFLFFRIFSNERHSASRETKRIYNTLVSRMNNYSTQPCYLLDEDGSYHQKLFFFVLLRVFLLPGLLILHQRSPHMGNRRCADRPFFLSLLSCETYFPTISRNATDFYSLFSYKTAFQWPIQHISWRKFVYIRRIRNRPSTHVKRFIFHKSLLLDNGDSPFEAWGFPFAMISTNGSQSMIVISGYRPSTVRTYKHRQWLPWLQPGWLPGLRFCQKCF